MGYTLKQFAAKCHDFLKKDPGPAGREQIRQLLEKVLVDKEFVATHLGPDNKSPRTILYEDPELKFCIVAHVHEGAKASPPHDHGSSWAIYGQVAGTTEMTEWRLVKPSEDGKPGLVEPKKVYELRPGMATLYNVGDLHSPRRDAATRLVRIEGQNLDHVKRVPYEPAAHATA